MLNAAYEWMSRGLAGLVTMIEGEVRKNPRVNASTHETLKTWAERLRAAVDRMTPQ